MSPSDARIPDGTRAWTTLTVGTNGGRPLVERVSLTEAKIIEVVDDVSELKVNLADMKKTQSNYGKSTIFLLLTTLLGILLTFLKMHA